MSETFAQRGEAVPFHSTGSSVVLRHDRREASFVRGHVRMTDGYQGNAIRVLRDGKHWNTAFFVLDAKAPDEANIEP